MHRNQKGFGHIGILLTIVLLALVGLSGWFVWKKNNDKNEVKELASSSKSKEEIKTQPKEEKKVFSLLDGKVTFEDDGTWKVATGGYWSSESGKCGRGIDVDPDCLDHKMLIPASETFTNPDQFQVNLTVFKIGKSLDGDNDALRQWSDLDIANQNEDNQRSFLELDGHSAIRTEWSYADSSVAEKDKTHVSYVIAFEDKIAVLRSTVFNGDHYGYKSTTDFRTYMPKIDALAKAVQIKE